MAGSARAPLRSGVEGPRPARPLRVLAQAELTEIAVNDIPVSLRPASASPRGQPVAARSQLPTPRIPAAPAHPSPHPLFLDHWAQGDGQEGMPDLPPRPTMGSDLGCSAACRNWGVPDGEPDTRTGWRTGSCTRYGGPAGKPPEPGRQPGLPRADLACPPLPRAGQARGPHLRRGSRRRVRGRCVVRAGCLAVWAGLCR